MKGKWLNWPLHILLLFSFLAVESSSAIGEPQFEVSFLRNCWLVGVAPKSPKLNGHVERINGTWRTDFYETYDLPTQLYDLRPLLNDYMDTYNWDRPHEALDLQTPQEFLESKGFKIRASQSHM